MKATFLQSLESFQEKARGTPSESHVQRFLGEFNDNFDHIMLKIFLHIGLSENQNLIDRILQNTSAPQIEPSDLEENTLGEAITNQSPQLILINREKKITYQQWKSLLIHEFSHTYLEFFEKGKRVNPRLKEGITEMLAQEVGHHCDAYLYGYETKLARYLFTIDKDALMDFYTGGSMEQYKERLREKLTPFISPKEADMLVENIASLSKNILEKKFALTEKAEKILIKDGVVLGAYKLALDCLFGNIDLNEFEKRCKEIKKSDLSSAATFSFMWIYNDFDNIEKETYSKLFSQLDRVVQKRLYFPLFPK